MKWSGAAILLVALARPAAAQNEHKIGPQLRTAASSGVGSSHVIIRTFDSASLPSVVPIIEQAGGKVGLSLPIIAGQAAYVPNAALNGLANNPLVASLSLDRPIGAAMDLTGPTVGATDVRKSYEYDGSGIGVAIIDSGITSWHDDLQGPTGGQRVDRFVDFVNGQTAPYDDLGHGTHVAGIVAGNGFDSGGARSGISPGVHLTVLKVIDASGKGLISNVIAALDYVVANKAAFNIRVINLSVVAAVLESYSTDPLTVAAERAVRAGIVVVASAGNGGKSSLGVTQYGGELAPGNAPWVLTVGASSHMGTIDRSDDTMAAFSSRGPTAVDYAAKPDLVAPGVGTASLSDPLSAFYRTRSAYLLSGTVATPYLPYLSLSGTSMAAPVVTGTVALMLQANPALTPNAVKAILQYTSQKYVGYDALTQGAGFLNAKGAVRLARYFAEPSGQYPSSSDWTSHITWGNHRVGGGRITLANAWALDVTWGSAPSLAYPDMQWGEMCSAGCGNSGNWSAWKATCADSTCGAMAWGADSGNVVWGTTCGGNDCPNTVWTLSVGGSAIYATADSDTVVWGSSDGDTVVWGSSDGDTVVWGSSDGDTVVWGANCSDPSCEPVIWNR